MYPSITVAKAIGILLVVAGHFTSSKYMPVEYTELKTWIFSFHMPLFMLLSGFLFRNTVRGKQGNLPFIPFVKKKFVRLMVPYFFLSFCIALLNFVLGHFIAVKRVVDWKYIGEIFYTSVGGSAVFLWFIYSLFIIFVIAALFLRIRHGMVWMGVFSTVLYFIPLPSLFYLSSVHIYLLYFWSGMLLFDLMKRETVKMSVLEMAVSAVLFAGVYYLYRMSGMTGWAYSIVALGCGLTGSYVVVCLAGLLSRMKRGVNILLLLGTYSASIYLLHMAGVYLVRLAFERLGVFTPVAYFVALLLAVMVGAFLPIWLTKGLIYRSKYLTLCMGGK